MPPVPTPPDGRFLVAWGDDTLIWSPTWVRVDSYPSLVTSYTIDRGRQYELDRTDTGRATVQIADTNGILDPTNTAGPFHGQIQPLKQAMIGRHNPITNQWHTRFRGWIESYDYSFDPSQKVNRLTVSLVDIFEILAAIEMQLTDPTKPAFGDQPTKDQAGNIVYDAVNILGDRITQALADARIPDPFSVVFSGNVKMWPTIYSPGETVMNVLTDCADAEFPGVATIYTDRRGRFVFHGRLARFTPEAIAGVPPSDPNMWDWYQWDCGDGAMVNSDPANTAHIRTFVFDRGLAKIINSATATPAHMSPNALPVTIPPDSAIMMRDLTDAERLGQYVADDGPTGSIAKYGYRSWSAENLQTMESNLDQSNALVETKRFARYYVDNYKAPQNRVSAIGFRSMHPSWPGAATTWDLMSRVDISDAVTVTVDSPGGGGFTLEPYFVEGVHEQVQPLGTDAYDDVTVTLDLSPRAYYASNPWA